MPCPITEPENKTALVNSLGMSAIYHVIFVSQVPKTKKIRRIALFTQTISDPFTVLNFFICVCFLVSFFFFFFFFFLMFNPAKNAGA